MLETVRGVVRRKSRIANLNVIIIITANIIIIIITIIIIIIISIVVVNYSASLCSVQVILWLQGLFLFSLVWSVGGTIMGDSKKKFDVFFRALIVGADEHFPKPAHCKFSKVCIAARACICESRSPTHTIRSPTHTIRSPTHTIRHSLAGSLTCLFICLLMDMGKCAKE